MAAVDSQWLIVMMKPMYVFVRMYDHSHITHTYNHSILSYKKNLDSK